MSEITKFAARVSGVIALDDDLATLKVPEDFYFLDAQDTERVLVAWGNPPGQDDLGMLLPANCAPFDDGIGPLRFSTPMTAT